MANYTKLTDFASKDALPTGNAAKIVKGTEIDDEFEAIEIAVATKSDIASPAFTGLPTAPTAAAGTNTLQLATTAHVFAERSNTATLTNKTVNLTSNTLTGTTAQFNTALSDDNFATLTNTVTLTNKTLTAPTISDADLTGTPTAPTAATTTDTTQVATTAFVQQEITANAPDLSVLYPVGSVYINASVSTNPGTLLGFGTWSAFGAGRVLVGLDAGDTDFDTVEETGGAKTHTLTIDEMPSHTHTQAGSDNSAPLQFGSPVDDFGEVDSETGATGGDQPHNNLQPYIVVYMWKRTA